MTEHVHEYSYHEGFNVWLCYGCQKPDGSFSEVLDRKEITARLNECETLETVNAELRRELRLLRTSFRYYKRLFAKEASRIDALLIAKER